MSEVQTQLLLINGSNIVSTAVGSPFTIIGQFCPRKSEFSPRLSILCQGEGIGASTLVSIPNTMQRVLEQVRRVRPWETTPASLVVTSAVGGIQTRRGDHRNKLPGATEYMGPPRPHARDHHHRHLPLGYKKIQVQVAECSQDLGNTRRRLISKGKLANPHACG